MENPSFEFNYFQRGLPALATLTTVGYGDVYPITLGGKVFTFFVLMIGLGIVAVPSGLIANAFSQPREQSKSEEKMD